MRHVDSTVEEVIPSLEEAGRARGKEQLLGLKEGLLASLKRAAESIAGLGAANAQLRQENQELLDVTEEHKLKIEGLEEDLLSKLLGENKRFRRLLDELDGETHESARLAKNMITKVVKRDLENQRLWKIKKRLTRQMVAAEKELFDQMELLFSSLVPADFDR